MSQQVNQHGGLPHQPYIIVLLGVLKTVGGVFDGGVTERYPDTYGCILLVSLVELFVERHTCLLLKARAEFPIHFLKLYSCLGVSGADKIPGCNALPEFCYLHGFLHLSSGYALASCWVQ